MRSTTISTVGFFRRGCRRSFWAAKHHQQRFAGTLEMPDQALPGRARQHPFDDLVGRLVLLIAADDLDAALLPVRGEQGEAGQDVQHHMGPQHAFRRQLQALQAAPLGHGWGRVQARGFFQIPRPPILHRQAQGTVVVFLALGGHGKHIADEQLGHVPFVIVMHLQGPIHPAHRRAGRRLGLDQHQGQAVHQQHQVSAALHAAGAEGELLGDHVLVLLQVVVVDQPHRHMGVVLAEGHGPLAAQPGGHFLIGADQTVGAHRQHDGAQLVEHLVGPVRLGGDLRIEADQRFLQPGLHQHVLGLAGDVGAGDALPAEAVGALAVTGPVLLDAHKALLPLGEGLR
jgi:hypothetical protein